MHNRHSIRLKGYDYSSDGYYFITICTYNKQPIFGIIEDGVMNLNDYGKIAHNEWIKSDQIRNELKMDEFIIMPDHIHGIVIIENNTRTGCACWCACGCACRGAGPCAPTCAPIFAPIFDPIFDPIFEPIHTPTVNTGIAFRLPKSISSFISGYKSSVTTQINRMRNTRGEKIWQRNYYDHIIHGENDYYKIAEYIRQNPMERHKKNNTINT